MKKWYLFYTEEVNLPKLHQLGGELRRIEIQYPEKLHQLGGEIMEQDVSDLTCVMAGLWQIMAGQQQSAIN